MKAAPQSALYRQLPSVDELLRQPEIATLAQREGHTAVAEAARNVLARLRDEISAGRLDAKTIEVALGGMAEAIERQLRAALAYSLETVINATGVVLHTNLGRAPLSAAALEHMREIASGYSNLEFDLATGERGRRDHHAGRLFSRLLGQQAGLETSTVVVNNCAAAVLLALNTLAEGGEVIVSRGELVEIGGSFRVPEIMAKSGALLREVGTTNRTRIVDYEKAITTATRMLLRVHRSNFRMVGFTESPRLEELVALGAKHRIPVVEDLGSGALFDLRAIGVNDETTVAESLRAGADAVTYSGDKLLAGPQAGLLSGKPAVIARMRANPLFRALRVDKLTYAALEATLLAYLRSDMAALPAIAMMQLSVEEIRKRASALMDGIPEGKLELILIEGESVPGGGAAPGAALPTLLISVHCEGTTAGELAAALRRASPPVIARVEEGAVLLDLRTVLPAQDAQVAAALRTLAETP